MDTHTLTVGRTARYCTLGDPTASHEVWFVLHGYGQLAEFFIQSFDRLDDGARFVVAPEALSRFYTQGMDGRVGASWMTSAARQHEIHDYVQYLDALYEHLRDEWPRTAAVRVLGFSQGAATACRWTAFGEAEVNQLILWAGGVPPDLDLNAHRELLDQLDLTLIIGTKDEYISDERIAQEEARLDAHDITHRTIRFDGPHRIKSDVLVQLAG